MNPVRTLNIISILIKKRPVGFLLFNNVVYKVLWLHMGACGRTGYGLI